MLKKRIIPVILLRNGNLVQSKDFKRYKNIGNPVTAVKRLSEWGADELIYLDISRNANYDLGRDDLGYENKSGIFDILEGVSQCTMMPSTIGGKIRTISDIEDRLRFGADKVSINTLLYTAPEIVAQAVSKFGSQCIVASIDVKCVDDQYKVFVEGGRTDTNFELSAWLTKITELGVGEILLNSIDNDGHLQGFDINMISLVCEQVNIPVIACGGAGNWEHLLEVLSETNVSAVAAANIFHYTDQSVYMAKKFLYDHGVTVRKPALYQF